jgi:hypothetical protein
MGDEEALTEVQYRVFSPQNGHVKMMWRMDRLVHWASSLNSFRAIMSDGLIAHFQESFKWRA